MKKRILLTLLFIMCCLFLMLAACSEPSSEGTGEGYFTISLSANENMRAVFPPTNSNDLRFSVKFKNTASGAEKTFTSDRSGSMKGKIGVGNYIVTMDINLISDGSLYARGVAYDNPVTIGSGQNPLKVYAFDVNNAAPPVISAKPQGAAYTTGATAATLTVAASVNDSGGLSYQWYSNTTNSTSNGTAIGNATSPNYTPSTGTPGTTWYYVIVKNTSAGKPTTINTVPVSIANSGTSGSLGSADNPFLVNDVTTLRKVGSGTDGWTLDTHYRQTADISLPAVSNWTPIGTETAPFTGSYDGNGKTISNLIINAPTESIQGLFGYIDSGAVVKNVGVVNCSIVGNADVGGVVGHNQGTVQNCYVTGSVFGNNTRIGGMIGGNGGTAQYCYATATVSGGTGSFSVGGMVGLNYTGGTVENCYATGNVSADSSMAGGVAGGNFGTLQYCYATGNISAGNYVGGMVGWVSTIKEKTSTMQNCVALNQNLSMSYTYSTGIGRIVGDIDTSEGTPILANNYGRSDIQKNGGSTSWANIGLNNRDGADVSASQYNSQAWWATTARWDFTSVWEWGSNNLPKLRGVAYNPGTNPQPGPGGTGTASDPFLVSTVANLQKVGSGTDGWSLSAHYKQTADIDLSSVSNWMPIGTTSPYFTGSYDGNGKTISNLTINAPTKDSQGLFGHIFTGAVVKNIGLVNCTIIAGSYVGGVVGYNYDGTVENCYVKGNVSGNGTVGGIVGGNYDGTVQDCYAIGNVSGDDGSDVGGVAGRNQGTMRNCYAAGSVSGPSFVGGVVGSNYGIVQNCYATGDVSGEFDVGGVIGSNNDKGKVQNCYATGDVSITGSSANAGGVVGGNNGTVQNCYATGNISGYNNVGGVVGGNYDTVQNCYATGNVSGITQQVGGVAGLNSRTVQYCYATGNVSGHLMVGGVVGYLMDSSSTSPVTTLQNCVALNTNVDYFMGMGRVLGSTYGTPIMANNYGRDDMKMNGGSTSIAWTNDKNDLDGESITSSNWGSQSWWTTAGNWATAGWDFTNIWQWGSNNLPILRNMPGSTTQNPVVK